MALGLAASQGSWRLQTKALQHRGAHMLGQQESGSMHEGNIVASYICSCFLVKENLLRRPFVKQPGACSIMICQAMGDMSRAVLHVQTQHV